MENSTEFIKKILRDYGEQLIRLNDVVNYGESLQDFLWHKYGDKENFIFPKFEEDHPFSIPIEVVYYMEGFEVNFTMLPQDVPHFIEFLDTPKGKEKEGWAKIRKYLASLKLEDRIAEEERQGMHRQ